MAKGRWERWYKPVTATCTGLPHPAEPRPVARVRIQTARPPMSIVAIVAAEQSTRSLRQESQQFYILSAAPPRMVRDRQALCSRLAMAISTVPPPQVERRTRAPYSG